MVQFAVDAISLESDPIGGHAESLRLPCAAVRVTGGVLLVNGLHTSLLAQLPWPPDYLSFEAGGERHRFPVARPAITGPRAARFPIL